MTKHTAERRMSGFGNGASTAETLSNSHIHPGQSYPQHYPHTVDGLNSPLGAPLSIGSVGQLLGCSAWTVRQKYVPQGLPHLRSGPSGKLIFFHDQVVRWILQQQQKGANPK